MSSYVVVRAALLATRQEAVDYYAARVAGLRTLTVAGRSVEVVFPSDGTHLYSEEPKGEIPPAETVVRRVPGGRVEVRRFSLDRARLLDDVTDAIQRFTVSIPGTGPASRENRLLHGPRLPDGRYLRVVLRPGPLDRWTCVSAYPVEARVWLDACRAKRARFPP